VFNYGGIFLAAAAAVVARSECVRRIPLLIVHALMSAESVGLAFFLARLSGVPAARVLFVVGGEVRCRAVGLLLSVALLSVFRLLPMLSSVPSGGCCARTAGYSTGSVAATVDAAHGCLCPVYVIRGNACVVLSVWCLWAKNRLFVVCVSSVGAGPPALSAAAVSSVQHCSPHTMASCCLRGKMGVGRR
jgi:hypothetical protein